MPAFFMQLEVDYFDAAEAAEADAEAEAFFEAAAEADAFFEAIAEAEAAGAEAEAAAAEAEAEAEAAKAEVANRDATRAAMILDILKFLLVKKYRF